MICAVTLQGVYSHDWTCFTRCRVWEHTAGEGCLGLVYCAPVRVIGRCVDWCRDAMRDAPGTKL